MTVTAEDILTEAINGWQGGEKWCQGIGGRRSNGATCLVLGLAAARTRLLGYELDRGGYEAWNEACRSVFSLVPAPLSPASWNDRAETRFEDVLLLVEQARANLKAGK